MGRADLDFGDDDLSQYALDLWTKLSAELKDDRLLACAVQRKLERSLL
jgi:hypothetical protein